MDVVQVGFYRKQLQTVLGDKVLQDDVAAETKRLIREACDLAPVLA